MSFCLEGGGINASLLFSKVVLNIPPPSFEILRFS